MSAEVLSQQYSGYLTSLRKLNTQYIQRLSEDTKKSFSEKIEKIKVLQEQNNSQEYSLHERVKKLQLTEGAVKKLLQFNQKLISQVLQSSQDYEVKREKIKALQQENDDQINDYYQSLARYSPTSPQQSSIAVRSYSDSRSENLSDAQFVKNLHKGRLIRGVFIGMNPSEYHVFFLRENVPPLIVIDDQSVKSVEITYPDKASTKISVTQFESTEQKEFFKKDSYTGSVNFSANFSANSLFYSVSVGASAEYSKETDFTGATKSERKFYSLNRSNLVNKRNITFNKRELVFQNAFKNKIRELEGVYKTCNGNLNELKKLNKRIFKEIYEEYGTHFNIGAYYVGGRFDYSAQTKYDADSQRKQVKEAVSYKVQVEARASAFGMGGGFSFGISNSNSTETNQQAKSSKFDLREETNMKGGSGASVENFMDSMNYNSDWVVLGQSKIQSSYVPMWEIVQKSITDLNTGFYRELQNSYIRFLKYKLETYEKWLISQMRGELYLQCLNQQIWKTNGTGFGHVTLKEDRRYIGNLLNREPHGYGAIYNREKVAYVGVWKKGILTEGYNFRSKSWYSFSKVSQQYILNQSIGFSISLNDWIKLRELQLKLLVNQRYTLGLHTDFGYLQGIYLTQYSQGRVNKSLKLTTMIDKQFNHFINCYGIGEQETVSYTFILQSSQTKNLTIGLGPRTMFKDFRWGSLQGFVYDTKNQNIYNGPDTKKVSKTIDSKVTLKIQRTSSECTLSLYANNEATAYFSEKMSSAHANVLLYLMVVVYEASDVLRIEQPF